MMKTVFDVGMFDGSDTKYYAELGFRVIAVEANPTLAERARKRLADGSHSLKLQVGRRTWAGQTAAARICMSWDSSVVQMCVRPLRK